MSRRTVPALLRDAERRFGSGVAVVDGGAELTWRELASAARRVGSGLRARGIARGDRVAVWAPNSLHWVVAALGVHEIGAVLVPLNTRYTGPEARDILRRARVRLLLTVDGFLGLDFVGSLVAGLAHDDDADPSVGDVVAGLPDLRDVVLFPGDRGAAEGRDVPTLDWDRFLDGASDAVADAGPVDEHDLADVVFTSGTTGRSKGVMYGHGQFLRVVAAWISRVGLRRGDRVLVIPPFFHAFGYRSGAIASLICGATMLPHQVYDPDAVLRRVERDRVSVVPGPPAIFQGMLSHPHLAAFDLSPLRLGITGGAVVPSVLINRMRSELGFKGVCNGYGLTECGGYGAMCHFDDPDEAIANTAGPPLDGVEIITKDSEGRALPYGETGEIVLRGYLVMQGYFNDPEATAETIDAEGWLHTGDVGRLDADGNLVVEDRLKDMYIAGGFNCYPAEIERMLSQHPAIGQAAVIGVPDERLGEVGKAFVVLRPGAHADEAEIIAWSRRNMANFKVPRSVEIVASLPTSVQGKVLRRELRAMQAR